MIVPRLEREGYSVRYHEFNGIHTVPKSIAHEAVNWFVERTTTNHREREILGSNRARQRRMGVEPTRDRAKRPPSRFEDGETHRGPYTSICMNE
jgi:hypothetical protein